MRTMSHRRCLAGVTMLMACFQACGADEETPEVPQMQAPETITVTSTAFAEGEPIPPKYTCDGGDLAPPLSWHGVPAEARAVALVVDDPDAPRGTFTHWVVLDLAPEVRGSEEGSVPAGGVQARNSAGKASYFGPCPPSGTHRYRFTVYALREPTGLPDGAGLDQALRAVTDRAVAWGRLTGTYSRA